MGLKNRTKAKAKIYVDDVRQITLGIDILERLEKLHLCGVGIEIG